MSLTAVNGGLELDASNGERVDTSGDTLATELEELKTRIEGTYAVDVKIELLHESLPLCPHQSLAIDTNVLTLTFDYAYRDLPTLQYNPGSSVGGLDVVVEEVQNSTYEYVECSNEGLCDYGTGSCECFYRYDSSDGRGNKGKIANCGFKYGEALGEMQSGGGGGAAAEGA